ncbi:MAG: DegV family EDD domain-containing protein [Candidatus Heimdallarchaeota archaeon]|nr:DegV family EDD domain-containing protein [Candidatus Heimdallarchaeota archaeon]MCK4876881.1 DegV family EDD domain-containing protein [Candidatus Heimdallarchaeota archaeon]
MKVKIITDSAVDLPIEFIENYDIDFVPHTVSFGEEVFKIGVGISVKEYYKQIEKIETIPKNAPPSLRDFHDVFQSNLETNKYDHLIYVAVSEVVSSVANVARLAAREFGDKITIVYTEAASGVQGLIIITILKLLEIKVPINQILEEIEKLKENYILVVGFYTLDNVYKSGRLDSKLILYLTKIIKIKPTAVMEKPGNITSKIPGFFFGFHLEKRLKSLVIKKAQPNVTYNMIISHVENLEGAERIAKKIKKKIQIKNFFIADASPIIGTNTGMKTLLISLIPSLD